ncbi:cytochrome b-c1 complex subunit 2, mitochondrial isoform X1 [Aplysia californica]|uniref:Cytochrome b-c1 complex subunit 2, mitochondrial isoform X1 n=1 Tax=Aplysia californica TaxID=6500 RepID=A0ABM0JF86_APLCA|nr:cytochrome b-c1 complex subunit 2, mitochondrial isoform X1 [Aplysia californica]
MASGVSRPLARSLKARMFSAAAAQAESTSSVDREPRAYIKKLNNGLLVGTIETPSPVARLAVVANAGSRFETGENLGISHVLRHTTQLRTENMSSLGITRAAQQLGSDITAEGTREYIYYKSNVTRNCAGKVVEILREISTKHSFKPWEVDDLQADPDGLKLDLALLKTQPQVRVVELLHSAAFRDTLGRSLYAPDFSIGKFNSEQLLHYAKSNFGVGRLALVGVGIDSSELEALGEQFEPYASTGAPAQPAVYYGGEVRENTGGELSYVAFALGGPKMFFKQPRKKSSPETGDEPIDLNVGSKDLLPSEVLKYVLGVGPHVKYSSGSATSELSKAVSKAVDVPHFVSAFTANYSDAGLFGFTAVAQSSQIDKVARAGADQLRSVLTSGISDKDVERAKTQLKASICMQFENPDVLLSWLGEQTLNSDQVLTPQEVYKMVDAVTTADVNNAAKKIASSKPTMAAAGNTVGVPYLDQLSK